LGDCLDFMRGMDAGSVDAVITDPPYKLTSGGLSGVMTSGIFDPSVYNNSGSLFNVIEFQEWIPEVYRALKTDADFYMMVNDKNMRNALNCADLSGFKLHNILVWDRVNQTPNRWYMKQCEFILYFWKGRARNISDMGTSALFSLHCKMGDRFHPTEKPEELMQMITDNSTRKGDTILDPFMGSGTTGVACMQLGRRFIGCEIDAGYFKIAEKRISEAAAQPALFHLDAPRIEHTQGAFA